MSNGFTQRFKGKIQAAALWLGNSAQFGPTANRAYSTAAGTNGLAIGTIGPEAVPSINASSALSVWQLTGPIVAGSRQTLDLTVSSAAFIKAPTGVSFDGSTNTVFKSTYTMRVSMLGLSSVAMRITDVYPDTTAGGAPVGGITLSTTT